MVMQVWVEEGVIVSRVDIAAARFTVPNTTKRCVQVPPTTVWIIVSGPTIKGLPRLWSRCATPLSSIFFKQIVDRDTVMTRQCQL